MCSVLLRVFLQLLVVTAASSSNALATGMPKKKKVIVSGAGGQTGQSLFRKLLALPEEFEPVGLVRTAASKQALLDAGGGVPEASVVVVDITDAAAVEKVVSDNDDVSAFCICTSAKPAPTDEINPETGRPVFAFPNGDPELVDWLGQKNQIDACVKNARAAGDSIHVVLCSTMGGTNANHPLNNMGRTEKTDGTSSGGMIVQWKRKSEVYLIQQAKQDNKSGNNVKYTIVHPGGLVNEPGGRRELVVGVDDEPSGSTTSRSVPREDVAQVMLAAVRYPEHYGGRSFDVRAKPQGEGTPQTETDFATTLLDSLRGRNCDYSLGKTM